MNRKWQYFLAALIVVLLGAAAFFFLHQDGAEQDSDAAASGTDNAPYGVRWQGVTASTRAQLTIAVLPTMDCLPIALAYEKGWFENHGVRVNLLCLNAQMDVDTALIGGSAQVAFTDIIRAERMKKKGIQLDYLISTNTHWTLVANKNARLTNISQLGDKMVAMARYSATDHLTDIMTKQAKAKNTIFRVQVNDVQVRLKMLLTGAMDAAWMAEPQTTQALARGHKVLNVATQSTQPLGVIVSRMGDVYKPDFSKWTASFIKAYNQAIDSINQYGVTHYADVCCRLTKVPKDLVAKIPNQHYRHATKPSETSGKE